MWNWLYTSQRPSWIIASVNCTWLYPMPQRASFTRYGARLIDSMPPATMTSPDPARIASRAIATAFIPLAHTLFTVTAPIRSGRPARSIAWRAGACPRPALITFPMITSSTSLPWIPARLTASAIAMDPSFTASTLRSARPYLPIGVRHALPMTMSVMSNDTRLDVPRDIKRVVSRSPVAGSRVSASPPVPDQQKYEDKDESPPGRQQGRHRPQEHEDGQDSDVFDYQDSG